MKIFYTYLWLREGGTPYYVGKGCGRCSGKPLSLEHRRKISESGRGLKRSEATRQRMREVFKGRVVSPETRKKIALSLRKYFKEGRES